MAAHKNITKIVVAAMAVAICLCLAAMAFAEQIGRASCRERVWLMV